MLAASIGALATALVESPVELFRHQAQAGTVNGNFVQEMVTSVRKNVSSFGGFVCGWVGVISRPCKWRDPGCRWVCHSSRWVDNAGLTTMNVHVLCAFLLHGSASKWSMVHVLCKGFGSLYRGFMVLLQEGFDLKIDR
jgi:hypothetical protein